MRILFLVVLIGISPSRAADEALKPMGRFTSRSVGLIEIPRTVISSLLFAQDLEREGTRYRGVAVDLNGDGAIDYFVRKIDPSCGTGGCTYAVIDGARRREIGEITASSVVVLKNKINGFPIIQSASSHGAYSAEYVSHVYDGREYTIVSRHFVGKEGTHRIYPGDNDIPLFPGQSVSQ